MNEASTEGHETKTKHPGLELVTCTSSKDLRQGYNPSTNSLDEQSGRNVE